LASGTFASPGLQCSNKELLQEVPHIETRWDFSTSTVRDQYSINLYPYPLTLRKVIQTISYLSRAVGFGSRSASIPFSCDQI
jgi:hypothetical protein